MEEGKQFQFCLEYASQKDIARQAEGEKKKKEEKKIETTTKPKTLIHHHIFITRERLGKLKN